MRVSQCPRVRVGTHTLRSVSGTLLHLRLAAVSLSLSLSLSPPTPTPTPTLFIFYFYIFIFLYFPPSPPSYSHRLIQHYLINRPSQWHTQLQPKFHTSFLFSYLFTRPPALFPFPFPFSCKHLSPSIALDVALFPSLAHPILFILTYILFTSLPPPSPGATLSSSLNIPFYIHIHIVYTN